MPTVTHPLSGRPQDGEFGPCAKADIDYVAGEDAVAALAAQLPQTLDLLTPVAEALASTFVYAPGKWTLRQVVGHMMDDKRIFAYRTLCVARNDSRPLPGFDEGVPSPQALVIIVGPDAADATLSPVQRTRGNAGDGGSRPPAA